MQDAVDTLLANTKIAANETADRIQANLDTLRELGGEHKFLFIDAPQLVLKANDEAPGLSALGLFMDTASHSADTANVGKQL